MNHPISAPVDLLDHGLVRDLRERQNAVLGSASQMWHVVSVLTELDVADLVADGPRTVEELAELTRTHAPALRRVLRCAASVGIFAERGDGSFGLSPLAEGLRSDRVGGLGPMVRMHNMEWVRRSYEHIMHSVRTGEPGFDVAFGMPFHQYLAVDPELAQFYQEFLAHFSRRLADRFVARLGLHRFATIADIGAGTAHFLARMLQEQPTAMGVLFDLPAATEHAGRVLAEHGVADRAHVVSGDPFVDRLPVGCQLYTLKSVLHRWPDEHAATLLRRVRQAMGDVNGRVIAIDQVVPPLNAWDHSKVIDIDTLVLYGGKERNPSEWRELLMAAGFQLCAEPEHNGWTFLEFRPSR